MDLASFVTGTISSLGISALIVFCFKEWIKSSLKKSVSKDLEKMKHELDIKKEILKDDLSRDAYKAQMMINNAHAIYPELVAKLEQAYGKVAALQGFRFGIDFKQYNDDDLKDYLKKQNIPQGKQDELMDLVKKNKSVGLKAIENHMRDVEVADSRIATQEAKNYRILKSIYCSEQVLKAFDECSDTIFSSWVDLDLGRREPTLFKRGVDSIEKIAPGQMDKFRKTVRSELRIE